MREDVPNEEEKERIENGEEMTDLLEELSDKDNIAGAFDEIHRWPQKFDAFLLAENDAKNRYPNMILYDKSRVKLQDGISKDDYYHASWADSYEKIGGYILAQAPFSEKTEGDFWRLCWQYQPQLIVLLSAFAQGKTKLVRDFFPLKKGEKVAAGGSIRVRVTNVERVRSWWERRS